jgi:hypothetical protein
MSRVPPEDEPGPLEDEPGPPVKMSQVPLLFHLKMSRVPLLATACSQMKRRSVEGLFQHPRLVTSVNSGQASESGCGLKVLQRLEPQQIRDERDRSIEIEPFAVCTLLNTNAKVDRVRARLTFAEISLEEIPVLSERIEWALLENLFQRHVPALFDPELECSRLASNGHAHGSEVQTVALVGVKEFGVSVVIVSHSSPC